jgi:hypothetical protein
MGLESSANSINGPSHLSQEQLNGSFEQLTGSKIQYSVEAFEQESLEYDEPPSIELNPEDPELNNNDDSSVDVQNERPLKPYEKVLFSLVQGYHITFLI